MHASAKKRWVACKNVQLHILIFSSFIFISYLTYYSAAQQLPKAFLLSTKNPFTLLILCTDPHRNFILQPFAFFVVSSELNAVFTCNAFMSSSSQSSSSFIIFSQKNYQNLPKLQIHSIVLFVHPGSLLHCTFAIVSPYETFSFQKTTLGFSLIISWQRKKAEKVLHAHNNIPCHQTH